MYGQAETFYCIVDSLYRFGDSVRNSLCQYRRTWQYANNGVYFFEQGEQELECKFLIYDRDSQVLYYYLSIM